MDELSELGGLKFTAATATEPRNAPPSFNARFVSDHHLLNLDLDLVHPSFAAAVCVDDVLRPHYSV